MAEMPNAYKSFKEYGPGEVVIKEGKRAEHLYVLMSGKLEVTVKGVKIAEISDKGSFVGEIASLLRCRRIATVSATEPSKLMVIGNITRHFEENPAAALGIAQTLASRIMEMNDKLVTYQKEVENWIQLGKDAIRSQDLTPVREALEEMQKLLLEGRSG